jgi:hypothetical protein
MQEEQEEQEEQEQDRDCGFDSWSRRGKPTSASNTCTSTVGLCEWRVSTTAARMRLSWRSGRLQRERAGNARPSCRQFSPCSDHKRWRISVAGRYKPLSWLCPERTSAVLRPAPALLNLSICPCRMFPGSHSTVEFEVDAVHAHGARTRMSPPSWSTGVGEGGSLHTSRI